MNGDPQNTKDAGAAAPAAPVKPKKPVIVMLNESIDFATVHGDRGQGDPDYAVCYVQGALPFNAKKELILNHHSIRSDEALQLKAEKLIRKAEKMLENLQKRSESDDDDEADDEDRDETEDDGGIVDLKGWAMGQKKYRWQLVTDAILMLTQRRVSSKRDALETLIEKGMVQMGQLSKEHKTVLNRL